MKMTKKKSKTNQGKIKKHAGGRPTIMTTAVLNKLEEVFAVGGTDEEACFYANISHQTLYDYQKINPKFVDRKEALKKKPILKARRTVVRGLNKADNARWFLERKLKKEFATRTELTGEDGKTLPIQFVIKKQDGGANNQGN